MKSCEADHLSENYWHAFDIATSQNSGNTNHQNTVNKSSNISHRLQVVHPPELKKDPTELLQRVRNVQKLHSSVNFTEHNNFLSLRDKAN